MSNFGCLLPEWLCAWAKAPFWYVWLSIWGSVPQHRTQWLFKPAGATFALNSPWRLKQMASLVFHFAKMY
jgi:hypothetical protein